MKYLNLAQLSAKLGDRSRSSIYRDVDCGRLPPPVRLGSRIYWVEGDIEKWLREDKRDADSDQNCR